VHPKRSLTNSLSKSASRKIINSLSTHLYDQKKGRDCYILLHHLACVLHAALRLPNSIYLHKKKYFFFLVFLIFLFLSIHFNMRFLRKDYMRYFGNRKSDCISYRPTVEFVSVKVVNAEKYFSCARCICDGYTWKQNIVQS